MSMLDKFREAQQQHIQRLKVTTPCAPSPLVRPSFSGALRAKGKGAVIAEYKRASPSKGIINLNIEPKDIASLYLNSGAAAISVLTEQKYFQGSLAYLDVMAFVGLPLLRKDFLLDPVQVAETATTPASALLLIVRMLDDAIFDAMIKAAKSFGLEAVIEVFNQADLDRVRASTHRTGIDPTLIQVNTRDLDTLHMDPTVLSDLTPFKQDNEIWIAASGVDCKQDIIERVALGYDAVLVGTGLMEKDNPGEALSLLTDLTK